MKLGGAVGWWVYCWVGTVGLVLDLGSGVAVLVGGGHCCVLV